MSDKRFVNVNPTESDVDGSRIRDLYSDHQDSCIVCGGETQTETEYTDSSSDLSYGDDRYVCVDCERMVTEVDDEFIEFYLTNGDISDIFGGSPDTFRDNNAISVM